ncbi:hypothetical protein [Acinetobacter baumannii]|nr:hypothetical protein [Acinetobacter baumannii]
MKATVNPDGSYTAEVPAGFADGELTVKAETVDRKVHRQCRRQPVEDRS